MSNTDPRILRTRKAILETARSMLLDEEPGQLTLRRIADEAGYSRQAVHTNFGNLNGILTAVALEGLGIDSDPDCLTEQLGDPTPLGVEELRGRVLSLVTRIDSERVLLGRIAHAPDLPSLSEALLQATRRIFDLRRPTIGLGDLDELASSFLLGGFANVLRDWVRGELEATPEAITDIITGRIAEVGELA